MSASATSAGVGDARRWRYYTLAPALAIYLLLALLPILLPGIVIGAIWKLMYNPDFGIINQLLGVVGFAGRDWLGDGALAIAKFAQEYEIKHGVMAAGAMLSVIPAVLLLLFAQRHIVKGLTAGAVK